MEESANVDEVGFVPDDISNIIKESIDAVLQNQQYSEQKVSQWTSGVPRRVYEAINKPQQAIQIRSNVHNHAENRCRTAHSCILLLGQRN